MSHYGSRERAAVERRVCSRAAATEATAGVAAPAHRSRRGSCRASSPASRPVAAGRSLAPAEGKDRIAPGCVRRAGRPGRWPGRPCARGSGRPLLGVEPGGLLERRRAAAVRRGQPPGAGLLLGVGADRLVEQVGSSRLELGGLGDRLARSAGSGSPTVIAIVLPREKSCGWSLVISRWVPHRTTGTSGTPAAAAIRAAPVLSSLISMLREMVASGKMPTTSPAAGSPDASSSERSPSARSTSMWCRRASSGR